MRNAKGQFVEGHHANPETEFDKGEHWRDHKPYWNRGWLAWEYWMRGKTCTEIAEEWNVGSSAIHYWMKKHGIPTRSISETRKLKQWKLAGSDNGMYGRTKEDNPNWRGGVTAERQSFYASQEWKNACRKVWQRDEGECQICGIEAPENIHCHHIIPFPHKPTRAQVDNLILLCKTCHYWVHSDDNDNNTLIGEPE